MTVDAYVAACIRRYHAAEGFCRAFARWDGDFAEKRAYVSDRMPAEKFGPIHGLPVAAAVGIDVERMPCDYGSALHAGRVAPSDAGIAAAARSAGAIIVGVTGSAEFSCFGSGAADNPCVEGRFAGGSGAAAVGAGMVPLAFDVRADGAISVPASYCGVYGLRMGRGAVSSNGVLSLAPSLEAMGLYVRHAADVALAARLFASKKGTRWREPGRSGDVTVHIPEGGSGYRIQPAIRSAINRAVAALSGHGVELVRTRLSPEFVKAELCYEVMFGYEVAQKLARDRDRAPDAMGEEIRARIDKGRRIDAAAYEQARRDAIALRSELLDLLEGDTVLLDAGVEDVAPPLENDEGWSPLQAPWAIAGLPTLSVPCGEVDGLPIGVQLAVAPGREDLLARTAAVIEERIAG